MPDARGMKRIPSTPNGLGLAYPDEEENVMATGIAPNELTVTDECDQWAKTPWHKYVHARLEAL